MWSGGNGEELTEPRAGVRIVEYNGRKYYEDPALLQRVGTVNKNHGELARLGLKPREKIAHIPIHAAAVDLSLHPRLICS